MKEHKTTPKCDPCEERFERNIRNLVREGEASTPKVRKEKEQEVKGAFAEHGKNGK